VRRQVACVAVRRGAHGACCGEWRPVARALHARSCSHTTQRDVAILEEPEHLNWFNHSKRWSDAFAHVVGIM
jgi:hypothetical protein